MKTIEQKLSRLELIIAAIWRVYSAQTERELNEAQRQLKETMKVKP